MTAFYNEIDPFAANWLRALIAAGHIAPGVVDERSIEDIHPHELRQYTQCHFFAGIGGWSRALRLAGWPDEREVWTGSCPCQPFSSAGKGTGFDDERHLWPAWYWLIQECRPGVIFGEQVASADGLAWLDLVQADLEAENYPSAAFDLCAAGVGAPHIRQRLYFVADCDNERQHSPSVSAVRDQEHHAQSCSGACFVAHTDGQLARKHSEILRTGQLESGGGRFIFQLGDSHHQGLAVRSLSADGGRVVRLERPAIGEAEPVRGFWAGADWIACRDGKWRPVEAGTFPLAHGVPGRVGLLRGYGNAIVPPLAAQVVQAYMSEVDR